VDMPMIATMVNGSAIAVGTEKNAISKLTISVVT